MEKNIRNFFKEKFGGPRPERAPGCCKVYQYSAINTAFRDFTTYKEKCNRLIVFYKSFVTVVCISTVSIPFLFEVNIKFRKKEIFLQCKSNFK